MSNGLATETALPRLQTETPKPLEKPRVGDKLGKLLTKLHLKSKTDPENSLVDIAKLGIEAKPGAELSKNEQIVTEFIDSKAVAKTNIQKIRHAGHKALDWAGVLVPGTLGALSFASHSPINLEILNSVSPELLSKLAMATGVAFITGERTPGNVAIKLAAAATAGALGAEAAEIVNHLPGGDMINNIFSSTDEIAFAAPGVIKTRNARKARKAVVNAGNLAPVRTKIIPTSLAPKNA